MEQRRPPDTLQQALNYINQAATEFRRKDIDEAKGFVDAAYKWGKAWEKETGKKLPGQWLQALRSALSGQSGARSAKRAAQVLHGVLRSEQVVAREARPVFGQGGAAGGAIRRLDQQLKQMDNQATHLDTTLPELGRKYDVFAQHLVQQGPEGQKEARRIKKLIRALDEAETHLAQLREALRDAINAR